MAKAFLWLLKPLSDDFMRRHMKINSRLHGSALNECHTPDYLYSRTWIDIQCRHTQSGGITNLHASRVMVDYATALYNMGFKFLSGYV